MVGLEVDQGSFNFHLLSFKSKIIELQMCVVDSGLLNSSEFGVDIWNLLLDCSSFDSKFLVSSFVFVFYYFSLCLTPFHL